MIQRINIGVKEEHIHYFNSIIFPQMLDLDFSGGDEFECFSMSSNEPLPLINMSLYNYTQYLNTTTTTCNNHGN